MKYHEHGGVKRSLNLIDVLQQTEYWVPRAVVMEPQPVLLTDMSCAWKRNAYFYLLRRAEAIERVENNRLLNYACDEIAAQGGSYEHWTAHVEHVKEVGVEGWLMAQPLMVELERQMGDEAFDGPLA